MTDAFSCEDVYQKQELKELFIKGPGRAIWRSMRGYWVSVNWKVFAT